jgi:hypothetical protein
VQQVALFPIDGPASVLTCATLEVTFDDAVNRASAFLRGSLSVYVTNTGQTIERLVSFLLASETPTVLETDAC